MDSTTVKCFDSTTPIPNLRGYSGGVYDGKYIYYVAGPVTPSAGSVTLCSRLTMLTHILLIIYKM